MIADGRVANRALAVGVVGVLACVVGAFVTGVDAFFQSYLVGAVFWVEIAFGCLGLAMLHTLTGGGWGALARRPFFAAAATMPLCALLFVPILGGLRALYPWARAEVVAHDELLQHKLSYLNPVAFGLRAALAFGLWSALALFLFSRASRRGDKGPTRSMRTAAGPGILASGLTMTFVGIDWIMSLDPHWSSTMLGLLVIVGSMLSAVAFSIVVVTSEEREGSYPVQGLHDLGNLLLLFTMLWAYLSFSQYLIIYAGNIADEVPFYVHRTEGGWQHLALSLILLHFAVPFVVLLSRRTKRNPRTLRVVALGILLMRLVELYWFVAPNFRGHLLRFGLLDVAAPLAVGGLWFYWFSRRLRVFDDGATDPRSRSVGAGKGAAR